MPNIHEESEEVRIPIQQQEEEEKQVPHESPLVRSKRVENFDNYVPELFDEHVESLHQSKSFVMIKRSQKSLVQIKDKANKRKASSKSVQKKSKNLIQINASCSDDGEFE